MLVNLLYILKCLRGGRQHADAVYTPVNETHFLPSVDLQSNDIQKKSGVKYFVICDKTGANAGPLELIRATPNPF